MWSFSKFIVGALAFLVLASLLLVTGCMSDSPQETDMPWSAPASWEGTMPMPSSYINRYNE
jgi:hypothetical protein